LFLWHPEGIQLSNMSKYELELIVIYSSLTDLSDPNPNEMKRMLKSINLLCSPNKNSIHEKISLIRKAFNNQMWEGYANHYIIIGTRGDKYTIKLKEKDVSITKFLKFDARYLQQKKNAWKDRIKKYKESINNQPVCSH